MYINTRKSSRKIKRNKTARHRAKIKAKNKKRRTRIHQR